MGHKHIADAEAGFIAINVTPDICIVDGKPVPFDIYQTLAPDKSNYAESVHARAEKVLRVGSLIRGVVGNAGAGVLTGTAQKTGDVLVVAGSPTVMVEGQPVARHDDQVLMNG